MLTINHPAPTPDPTPPAPAPTDPYAIADLILGAALQAVNGCIALAPANSQELGYLVDGVNDLHRCRRKVRIARDRQHTKPADAELPPSPE